MSDRIPAADNVTPLLPGCPQCGAIVGRKGHTCRARAEDPNWDPTNFPVTDPEELAERIAAVRQALAEHRPPESTPAASTSVLRDHALRGGAM